jgi:mono/diheme cytochrome c family protein
VVYTIYCRVCHGPAGEGDGTVAQRGFPTPPSLLAANARNYADGRIFHIVSFGQGNMPGYAAQIEPADRWKATLWVRRLQEEANDES